MLPLMRSNHGYHNNHHKHCNVEDDDYDYDDNDTTVNYHNYSTDSNKDLQIFKLKEKYM